jgi:hypothetical protein
MALVNAANVIMIAETPIQTPVSELSGLGGIVAVIRPGSPGTIFPGIPPETPSSSMRGSSNSTSVSVLKLPLLL